MFTEKKGATFYMDETGARKPDKSPVAQRQPRDSFGMGGFLIKDEDQPAALEMIQKFRNKFPQLNGCALHSYKIRNKKGPFFWLNENEKAAQIFYDSLSQLMIDLPIIGMACVIDRFGYNERYAEKYKDQRWTMCKTAFTISVERAVKWARDNNLKLNVRVEEASSKDDRAVAGYFSSLKSTGHCFDSTTSDKYGPLTNEVYQDYLGEIFFEKKNNSDLIQIADLYLWPIAMAKEIPHHQALEILKNNKKTIDSLIPKDDVALCGIKYSCY